LKSAKECFYATLSFEICKGKRSHREYDPIYSVFYIRSSTLVA